MLAIPSYLNQQEISDFIKNAIREDIGPGDYSSLASIDKNALGKAELIMKDSGVIAGIEVAREVFACVNKDLKFTTVKKDGDLVQEGELIFSVEGQAQSILSAERLALNILQRMSGIATKTADLIKQIAHTNCQILDTRKTTPNFRMFEKWAVYLGGGKNHRFALYDMIMLKDNHIDYAGGIIKAVQKTRYFLEKNKLDLKIEIETRNLKEVEEAVEARADIVMLDNMTPAQIQKAVRFINNRVATEASGGITEENIVEYAESGVDSISVGSLTHSYKSLDMSLKAIIS